MASRGRYSTSASERKPTRPEIHPVWRGIGCLLFIVIVSMSLVAAHELIEGPLFRYVPAELLFTPRMPKLGPIPSEWLRYPLAKLLLTVVFSFLLFGVLTIIYSLVYRAGGGLRPGPTDAPYERRKPRRR